jgi:hypothetical protein
MGTNTKTKIEWTIACREITGKVIFLLHNATLRGIKMIVSKLEKENKYIFICPFPRYTYKYFEMLDTFTEHDIITIAREQSEIKRKTIAENTNINCTQGVFDYGIQIF